MHNLIRFDIFNSIHISTPTPTRSADAKALTEEELAALAARKAALDEQRRAKKELVRGTIPQCIVKTMIFPFYLFLRCSR
jgi:hypothetical protein